MNGSGLDDDLKELAKRRRPDVPEDFNAAVWSKIRNREAKARTGWQYWLQAFLSAWLTSRWAVAALALALIAGWGLGFVTPRSLESPAGIRGAATVTGEVIDVACYFDDGASGPFPCGVCQALHRKRAARGPEGEEWQSLRADR
jgi:hypothetical protein